MPNDGQMFGALLLQFADANLLEALAHEQMLIQQGHIPRVTEEQAKQRQEIQLALEEQRVQEHHCELSQHRYQDPTPPESVNF